MTVTAAPFVRSSTPASLVDRRSSWIPNGRMIAARILELRKRRGLMIALIVVNIGVPTVFLAVRLIAHAVARLLSSPVLARPRLFSPVLAVCSPGRASGSR